MHVKCRNTQFVYRSLINIKRFPVPDDKVLWSTEYPQYEPPDFSLELGKPWEDPKLKEGSFKPLWNEVDGDTDRRSHSGPYRIDIDERPLNVVGRTGLRGRGCLGRWGPNHAADPVVTRWKRYGKSIAIHESSGKGILQFVAIERRDCGELAIPGGMVDANEDVSQTLKREFCEEAVASLSMTQQQEKDLNMALANLFKSGKEVYRGYVDDPRNTDNAWMETVVCNFHDESGETMSSFPLSAGDDAAKVTWMDLDSDVNLYASHTQFLSSVARLLNAHW